MVANQVSSGDRKDIEKTRALDTLLSSNDRNAQKYREFVQQNAIQRNKHRNADEQFKNVVDGGNFHPVSRHKSVATLVEGDTEEQ